MMFSFLSGTVGKVAMYASLAVALSGMAIGVVHEHDNRVIATVAAAEAAKTLETERADNARLVDALTARAAKAEAQAATITTVKEAIARAKPSNFSCLRSDAGRAALGGLRHNAGGH
jgi:hypothetical protein